MRPSEAKATEGAAPNNPAKVFGLSKSEISEKRETTKPPIKNLMTISFMGSSETEELVTFILEKAAIWRLRFLPVQQTNLGRLICF